MNKIIWDFEIDKLIDEWVNFQNDQNDEKCRQDLSQFNGKDLALYR